MTKDWRIYYWEKCSKLPAIRVKIERKGFRGQRVKQKRKCEEIVCALQRKKLVKVIVDAKKKS